MSPHFLSKLFKQKRIFLDYASTTPISLSVKRAMLSVEKKFENPSSLYTEGLEARRIMREARKKVADTIHVRPQEIVFTGSGTEADNLALVGIVRAWAGPRKPHVIVTDIEHPAILEVCAVLETEGVFVTRIKVKENGIVDPKDIRSALTEDTVLVSVMYANNEIGTIQPLKEIAKVIREYRHRMGRNQHLDYPYFHTDASQAPLYLDINREHIGVDLMTLDGSKIYGPKSIGVLYMKEGVRLMPIMYGGGQEQGLRPGTENISLITGFAEALSLAVKNREKESARLSTLQAYFFDQLVNHFGDKIRINGDRTLRIPNNINICVQGLDAEFAVIRLDEADIACSSASACATLKDGAGSYVIGALGEDGRSCIESSLRFTMGKSTTKREIDQTIATLQKIIQK